MIDWDECKSIRKQMVEMEMARLREEFEEAMAEEHREDMIRNSSGWYVRRRSPKCAGGWRALSEKRDHGDWWCGYLVGVLNAVFVAFLWWAWRVSG